MRKLYWNIFTWKKTGSLLSELSHDICEMDQSEISIMLHGPIRGQYCVTRTNERRVLPGRWCPDPWSCGWSGTGPWSGHPPGSSSRHRHSLSSSSSLILLLSSLSSLYYHLCWRCCSCWWWSPGQVSPQTGHASGCCKQIRSSFHYPLSLVSFGEAYSNVYPQKSPF